MSGSALSGHGALLEMELDPSGSPNTFTTVAEVMSDLPRLTTSRTQTETTPHTSTIDCYVSGVIRRAPLDFTVNFLPTNTTHDEVTGFLDALNTNETRGYRITANGATPGGADSWTFSGDVASWNQIDPVREGARSLAVSIQASGPMLVGSTVIGVLT